MYTSYKKVKAVEALPNYHLKLTFRDGEIRILDFRPKLNWECFLSLNDKTLFATVRVRFNKIEWNDGTDIAPEALHRDSIPLEEWEKSKIS